MENGQRLSKVIPMLAQQQNMKMLSDMLPFLTEIIARMVWKIKVENPKDFKVELSKDLEFNLRKINDSLSRLDSDRSSSIKDFNKAIQQFIRSVDQLDQSTRSFKGFSYPTPLGPQYVGPTGMPIVNIPGLPDTFKISNLGELGAKLDILKDILQISADENKAKKGNGFKPILDALKPLENISNSPKSPIAVRMSNGEEWAEFFIKGLRGGGAVSFSQPTFRDAAGLAVRALVDATGAVRTASAAPSERFAYVAAGNGVGKVEYIGQAAPGTLDSAAFWSIKKLSYNATHAITAINWADGTDGATKIWDDRATYTYS